MAFVLLLLVITSVFVVFMIILILWKRRINIERMEKENEEKFFSPDFNKASDSYETESISKVNMSNLRLIRLNELELCRILGRGAFGTVYEGYYKPLDQNNYKVRVAIKLLNKCKLSDEKAVTRMSEELFNVSFNKIFFIKLEVFHRKKLCRKNKGKLVTIFKISKKTCCCYVSAYIPHYNSVFIFNLF